MLHYRDLTQDQKDRISNGCGAAKAALFIPNFIFEADCGHHDFYYWRGATYTLIKWNPKNIYLSWIIYIINITVNIAYKIYMRNRADRLFYSYMIKDVWKEKHYDLRLFYFLMATFYYIIVSVLGIFFFNWRKQRTLKDIT